MGAIRVGVAGWDYPDWVGPVYPAGAGRDFDRLAWIARWVDVVEINSTFYRPARPRAAASWARRTSESGLRFTAKAHRSWTHEPEPPDAGAVRATLDGLAPLAEAGRLDALLLQFPQSFRFGPPAVERLERLAEAAAGRSPVVEVRHRSWAADEARATLARLGLARCLVDQPRVGDATLGLDEDGSGEDGGARSAVGYLRLHGRNRKDWFRRGAGRDARYDYLYSGAELDALAAVARRAAERCDLLFVVQNNHFRGQALVNALQWKARLESRAPRAPEELVLAYPALAGEVDAPRSRLF